MTWSEGFVSLSGLKLGLILNLEGADPLAEVETPLSIGKRRREHLVDLSCASHLASERTSFVGQVASTDLCRGHAVAHSHQGPLEVSHFDESRVGLVKAGEGLEQVVLLVQLFELYLPHVRQHVG